MSIVSPNVYGLTFQQALDLAEQQAPQLSANQAQIEAAKQQTIPAGSLPDPQLAVGIDNLPIQGSDSFSLSRDFMTMQRIGISQSIPNSGKLTAQTEVASQRLAMAEAETRLTRLQVLQETAIAWINRYQLEQQLLRLQDLEQENDLLNRTLQIKFASGRSASADLITPKQEAAMIAERRDDIETRLNQAIIQLKRWIGADAAQPLSGSLPDWPVNVEHLAHGVHQHPELDVFEPKTKMLTAEAAEAEAAKNPDWGVQLAYQHRGPAYSDMVSLQVSVDLPIFPETRKDPKIAAKLAERAAVADLRKAALLEHRAMLESELAEHQRLSNAIKRNREQFLPLIQQKSTLALADWQNNRGDLSAVINARRERIDTELKIIDLENQRLQLAARLHYTYSEQPVTQETQP